MVLDLTSTPWASTTSFCSPVSSRPASACSSSSRYLTGDLDAALVSATIFTLVPYRVEHFMHLELQWTMWMPLSLWAVHRAFDRGSTRSGLWAGLLTVPPGPLLRVLRGVSWLRRLCARRSPGGDASRPGRSGACARC